MIQRNFHTEAIPACNEMCCCCCCCCPEVATARGIPLTLPTRRLRLARDLLARVAGTSECRSSTLSAWGLAPS